MKQQVLQIPFSATTSQNTSGDNLGDDRNTNTQATSSQGVDPTILANSRCKNCSIEKSLVASRENLFETCTKCGWLWCMINNCAYQTKPKRKDNILSHQRNVHSETRRISNFNVSTGHYCQCDGNKNIIYTIDDTMGQCGRCKQILCLITDCKGLFPKSMDCVDHQHQSHTKDQRQAGALRAPSICGNCGSDRPPPFSKILTYIMCAHCKILWCTVGNCGYEYHKNSEISGHYQSFHRK